MNIFWSIKKELSIFPLIRKGYSRRMSNYWYMSCLRDLRNNRKKYSEKDIKRVHKMGYFASSIPKYNLLNKESCDFISDFEYMFLNPFNNSFSKWIEDMITTNKVLKDYSDYLQPIYFSIVKRDGKRQIYRYGCEDREYTTDDVLDLLKEKEWLIIRPSEWVSEANRYSLSYFNGNIYINNKIRTEEEFANLINELADERVIVGDYPRYYTAKDGERVKNKIRLFVTNDLENGEKILDAIFYITKRRKYIYRMRMDIKKGTFVYHGSEGTYTYVVPNWDNIVKTISEVTESLRPLSYFAIDIVVNDNGFTIVNFSANPTLPGIQHSSKLNDFLKNRFEEKKANYDYSFKGYYEQVKKNIGKKILLKVGRKGIRDYMQKLWLTAVKSDLKGTKLPLSKKIWAWKRGYISYHTYQYGLTEDNYKNYLADYDYYWLNRINNGYQKWVNDKTTFRFVMEPFKDSIPAYYYTISSSNGKLNVIPMQDCPYPDMDCKEGLFRILEEQHKLALKASAGTHGDGFYCMAYEDGKYFINGKEMTKDQIIEMIRGFKSFYLVTQWINLHHDLKTIYPNSVSSIRMMVINRHGYDPKIMQTYIRIGSSKTGFTDNVGYGGICAMIDMDTGKTYQPETIVDHVFHSCPAHPDTGTVIDGFQIPCWQEAKKLVLDISRSMPELEYLGYDVAITETGPQIIEINIHQDLHKCNTFSKEIMDFFNDKISQKKAKYNLK